MPRVSLQPAAHPRVCGENDAGGSSRNSSRGSSPRVRGKLSVARSGCRLRGLIPACAGKTWSILRLLAIGRAHPRVCGENSLAGIALKIVVGSSPRVRGKPVAIAFNPSVCRLIPAFAGKTARNAYRRRMTAAHPRVCGENAMLSRKQYEPLGSSPRVRGKRFPVLMAS